MPRFAILSDIHSNLHAFQAVIAEAEAAGVDDIAIAGDVVGYGANPGACAALVRSLDCPCVLGNHDFFAIQMRNHLDMLETDPEARDNPVWAGIALSIRELQGELLDWLADLPAVIRLPSAQLAHAALHNISEWPYLTSPGEATPTLALLEEPVGFFGHTHQTQVFFDRNHSGKPKWTGKEWIEIPPDGKCAITVGSVGQPRDGDPRASWVIWDSDRSLVQLRRTAYPHADAAAAILAAGLPAHSARRLLPRGASLPLATPAQSDLSR